MPKYMAVILLLVGCSKSNHLRIVPWEKCGYNSREIALKAAGATKDYLCKTRGHLEVESFIVETRHNWYSKSWCYSLDILCKENIRD